MVLCNRVLYVEYTDTHINTEDQELFRITFAQISLYSSHSNAPSRILLFIVIVIVYLIKR